MLNLCYCGTQDGYPHTPDCPRPLFRASDQQAARWQEERDELSRIEENTRYGQLSPNRGDDPGESVR